jgi:aldose 1-epimerase
MITEMTAQAPTKATPVNLASHSYWNLNGEGSGSILDQQVQIWASSITGINGDFTPVEQTPWDFREVHSIGSRIDQVPGPAPGGYDHNYVLEGALEKAEGSTLGFRRAARVSDPASGRVMELFTDAPGVQFYTGNFIEHTVGKGGKVYKKHAAFCLETQGFPNAVNQPKFPSIIVRPGETYRHVMVHKFSIN